MAFTYPNPTWSPTTTYNSGDKVNSVDNNTTHGWGGYSYVSLQNGNLNKLPCNNVAFWVLESDWDPASHIYSVGNKVTYQGSAFVCIAAHTSTAGNHPTTPISPPPGSYNVNWATLAINSSVGSQPHATGFKFFRNAGPVPAPMDGFATKYLDPISPGNPPLQSMVGVIFYRNFPGNPQESPGPSSVWKGQTVFRIPRTQWFTGIGQRANKPPVSHNNGD